MKWLVFILTIGGITASAGAPDYTRLTASCSSCLAIDTLITKFSGTPGPSDRRDLALKMAGYIHKMYIKGRPSEEQRREIYFAFKGTIEVFDDDFDSECVVGLMDLRTAAPANFDYVMWRFPIENQKAIVERMKGFKEDGIRPRATLPLPKSVDPN